jgi:hypothetical protein
VGHVSSFVEQGHVPEAVRSLSTFAHPDYVDLFTITTPIATDFSAEQWARAVLEQAPLSRDNARRLWRLMGLRLGPEHSPQHVQGWKIAARGDNWLRAATASWYMAAEAVCLVEKRQVALSLSLRYDRPVAPVVWALVSGPHQRGVPVMLRQAVRLQASGQERNPDG